MITIQKYEQEYVQHMVSEHFGIPMRYVLLPTRGKSELAWIRQVYTYCLWLFTDMKTNEIGRHIKRHHSVVRHSVDSIHDLCKVDKEVRSKIIEVESLFE